mmetsp:Transcript_3650/g.5295  ORF Transcript_3650/g.5295 Transcript_3650/m.5295 type:complete len:197 (-) Transcript_3650:330-920(-)
MPKRRKRFQLYEKIEVWEGAPSPRWIPGQIIQYDARYREYEVLTAHGVFEGVIIEDLRDPKDEIFILDDGLLEMSEQHKLISVSLASSSVVVLPKDDDDIKGENEYKQQQAAQHQYQAQYGNPAQYGNEAQQYAHSTQHVQYGHEAQHAQYATQYGHEAQQHAQYAQYHPQHGHEAQHAQYGNYAQYGHQHSQYAY